MRSNRCDLRSNGGKLSNKGTIRFPLSQPVPADLIERIAKHLAKEAAERARAKLAKSKKRR